MTAGAMHSELDQPPDRSRTRALVIASVIAVVVVLGFNVWFSRWRRRGGPRRVITQLAEDGAVKIADVVIDEVLGAA